VTRGGVHVANQGSRSDAEARPGIGNDDARRALERLRIESDEVLQKSLPRRLREVATGVSDWSSVSLQRLMLVLSAGLLIALFGAAAFVKYANTERQSVPGSSSAERPLLQASSSTTTTGPAVVVDVGGAVRSPGVYRLTLGSRVVDALESAGGPTEEIDTVRLNLAAQLVDGERVWIPRRGESLDGGSVGSAGQGTGGLGLPQPIAPMNLNTATAEQLTDLPGIGPATAKAIIEKRKTLGRFRSVDDLLTVKGIGSSKLDAIRSSVVVR